MRSDDQQPHRSLDQYHSPAHNHHELQSSPQQQTNSTQPHIPPHSYHQNAQPAPLPASTTPFYSSSSTEPASTQRRVRSTQACNHCHRRKARCTRNIMPDGSSRCDNCIRDNIPCIWRESKRRGPKRKATQSSSKSPTPQRSVASISNLLNESEISDKPNDFLEANNTNNTNNNNNNSRVGELLLSLTPAVLKDSESNLQSTRPNSLVVPRPDDLIQEFYSQKVTSGLRDSVLAYFVYLYAICPILHPSTLLRRSISNALDPLLIDVLHATNVFYSQSIDTPTRADALEKTFAQATQFLHNIQQQPTVEQICALQILDILMTGHRGYRKYDVFKSSLSTLIHQLGWHELDQHENLVTVDTCDEWIERETKRRVFWVNHKIDSQHSLMFSRRPLIEDTQVFVKAPSSESDWDELSTQVLLSNIGETDTETEQLRAIHTIQNSVTQTFQLTAPTEVYLSRLGVFFTDAKKNWLRQRNDNRRWTQNAEAASPLGDSLVFRKFDGELNQWRGGLVVAEELKDPEVDSGDIRFFGSPRARVFIARARYFCIDIYSDALTIFLHLSNRPSFLSEAEPSGQLSSGEQSLATTLLSYLGSAWALGLLSLDVNKPSWKKCLTVCHNMSMSISANSDIPVCFVDMLVPSCVFLGISVLLRQIKILDSDENRIAETEAVAADLLVLWSFFNDLGSLWNTETLKDLLKHLGIDQAITSA
ncbi:hypothetical protein J3B02_001939 [Coemansia erecta]|nr:hypothetical protein J3B02_001939 [Coemansia erecta]